MSSSIKTSSQDPGLSSVLLSIQKALLSLTQPGIFFRVLAPFLLSISIGLFCLIFFWSDITGRIFVTLNSIEWFAKSFLWIFSLFGSDGSGLLSFISGFLFFLFVIVAIYVITVVLLSTILVPLLVPVLRQRYHPELPLRTGQGNLISSVTNSLKATLVFLFLLMISLPFFLIPGAPIFISLILNSYLSQKIFPFDVLQDLASAEEIKAFRREHRVRLWILSLSTGLLIYIPLVNFLAPSIMALSFIFYILDNLGHFRHTRAKDQKI